MKNDFIIAITQLSAEKNLPKEVVLDAVEAALASAFRREVQGGSPNISVKINPNTGDFNVYTLKSVVAEPEDPSAELTLDEARHFNPAAQLGDVLRFETPLPSNAGRIAAQTAKQVVMQRLREAEREVVFAEFAGKEGDIVSGIIQRIEPKQIVVDLGKTEAILPAAEQVRTEHYRPAQRLKVYVLEVFRSARGPQVVISRTHRNLVRRLFELEVPEIYNGTVEIKAIAREPGYRSKVAVAARQEGVDAVGACVGLRGIRIQNIINELSGEKIDVIEWHSDAGLFVSNALSPAPVLSVSVNEEEKTATVVVPDRQLSLAIGREGQNARLAAKLTGWRIDIKSASVAEAERAAREEELAAQTPAVAESVLIPEAEVVPREQAPLEPEPAIASAEEPEELTPAAAVEAVPVEQLVPVAEVEEIPLEEVPPAIAIEEPAAAVEPVPIILAPEPAIVPPQRIRFAEEIFGAPAATAGKKTKGRKGRDDEEAAVVTAKPRRAKRTRDSYTVEEDDEVDDYAGLIPKR